MQQIAEWLENLGMSEYAQRFTENGISVAAVRHLTEQDLKDIGVLLGHRRIMLAAIGDLAGAPPAVPKPVAAAEPKAQDAAERRQVTVMFSDLVGSTALAGRMDPEDLREVISAYQKCVAETVRRFGGFVAKYMGDGVLVYFGYPQAHEDDAERAVRAGLELIAAVVGLKTHGPLQTRVGIATGLVVVGDVIGSGEAQERGIVGETPNLAARLQSVAEPNTVVIAESTRKLLGNLFELQDLGPKDLKGIAEPMRTWAALRASSVASRFEAMHATGLTALVGREEELELLLRRWSKAKTGEGQVVLLSGEAGIGKSRLTAAMLERLTAEPHTRLRYFCSPQHTDSAFYPIISQMERAAELAHDDTTQTKLDKLDAVLAQTSTSKQDAALLADMLSLPNDGRYPTLELTPEQRRQKTLEALISQVETLAGRSPVLMILEDAHWTDPTTLEAFGRVVECIRHIPVLLIVTFRLDFDAPWIGRPHVTFMAINRLGERDSGAMIDAVVGNKPLPATIRQDIIERTDGVPLFVEEMTKAVLEAESESAAQRTAGGIPSPKLAVPASLQASLMARLDRLGPAKEVAQIGAAIGREFSHALLTAVVAKSEPELESALDRLIRAGLLFRHGVPPHASYLFKHALVQDTAYGTLLREPRRALHARIAEILEGQFNEIAESQPELIARHCTEAGLIEKAAIFWGKAGQQSLARSALVEAAERFTRALAQIADAVPTTVPLHREQITFQVGLAYALMHLKGYSAPETKASLDQARLMIERLGALEEHPEDQLLPLSVLRGFWSASIHTFDGDVTCELAGQFLALAEKQTAPDLLAFGHAIVGTSSRFVGDFVDARARYDQAIALYASINDQSARGAAHVYADRSVVLWLLGYPEAALADANHALDDARKGNRAASLLHVLNMASQTHILCGNYAVAAALLDESVSLSRKTGSLMWERAAAGVQCWVTALTDKALDAVQVIPSAMTGWRSIGATTTLPRSLAYLAKAYAELGRRDNAWRCIEEALMSTEATKERWCEAEIVRVAGEIAVTATELDVPKAQAYFQRALGVARAQQAKSWELRVAMSMARLWRDQGKRDEAHDLLAPVYGWFTEGFDTLDLKEARALLEQVAS